jgi:hypothetical protein
MANNKNTYGRFKRALMLRGIDVDDKGQAYDYKAFYESAPEEAMRVAKGKGHFPDDFKTPDHPTFSEESNYSSKGDPEDKRPQGGSWVKNDSGTDVFVHSDYTKKHADDTDDYLGADYRDSGNVTLSYDGKSVRLPSIEVYGKGNRDAAAREMREKYKGNVDLLNRPSVDSKTMRAAGHDVADGSYASVYSSQNAFYDKSKGGEREILYTPILPDGTVMRQKDVDDYIKGLGEKGDIMEMDKPSNGGKGLVIGADYEPGDGPGARLHELQEIYYSKPEEKEEKPKGPRSIFDEARGAK